MHISQITFIDIETVPNAEEPNELFIEKFKPEIEKLMLESNLGDVSPSYRFGEAAEQLFKSKASLHAEFGKVIVIGIGKMVMADIAKPEEYKFFIRTLSGRHEALLLQQCSDSLIKAGGYLCAHNGMEFDFPFLMRRYMVNGIALPSQLSIDGVKPWDFKLIDTIKLWSGTQWNYRSSLRLMANIFGLPNPKSDMNGSDVAEIYFDSFNVPEGDLPFEKEKAAFEKIGKYCAGDVLTLANIYCKMKGLPIIDNAKVEYV